MAITKIAQVDVGAGGVSSISFTSIPQTGTDLLVLVSQRQSASGQPMQLTLNGSTTSYTENWIEGSGSTVIARTNNRTWIFAGTTPGGSDTANTFGNTIIYIPSYAGSTNKTVSIDNVSETNATAAYQEIILGLWANTAAITSLSLVSSGTWQQYSSASLYTVTKGNSGGATVA